MAEQSQPTILILASLVSQFEAWGKLTVKLFSELRRPAGLKPRKIAMTRRGTGLNSRNCGSGKWLKIPQQIGLSD